MKIINVFTMPECSYCIELKDKLKVRDIQYNELDVSIDENEELFNNLHEITQSDLLPMIIVDKHLLVGNKSFQTIDEAVDLIVKLSTE